MKSCPFERWYKDEESWPHDKLGQPKGSAMVRANRIIGVMVFLLMALPGMVWGGDVEPERETLKGIRGVLVKVTRIKPAIEKAGLTLKQIRTDVELKLHQTRLNVLTPKNSAKEYETSWPRLYVSPGILKTSSDTHVYYVYAIDLELQQTVHLMRKSGLIRATTWSTGVFGITGDLEKIRAAIKNLVDEFLNAWLSVNPK
jgi:hypothetical protein